MSPLEIALVILVVIWSVIFLGLGIALIFFLLQVKKALEKINDILEDVQDTTKDVGGSLKTFAGGFAAMAAKGFFKAAIDRFGKGRKNKK